MEPNSHWDPCGLEWGRKVAPQGIFGDQALIQYALHLENPFHP